MEGWNIESSMKFWGAAETILELPAHDASRVESGPLFVFIVWHVHAIQSDMLYLFALFMQANGNLTPTILIQRDQSQSKQPLEFVG